MKPYKLGYTTGVFDLFHIGHLNILRNAKDLCDCLVVGVSTDEVVWQYKHKKPVIPFEQRIEIVRAIKYVDEAIPQESMDKFSAWKKIRFDALFHGDDWKSSPMYDEYERQFAQVGVKVVFLPHTDNVSSTMLTKELKSDFL